MAHTIGRRELIKAASGAAALGWAGSLVPAGSWANEARELGQRDGNRLKALALEALDAARKAGAQFADVRVDVEDFMRILVEHRGSVVRPNTRNSATIGVRAAVNGAWGFAGGDGLTPDMARNLARRAVQRATAGRARRERALELAPAPVERDGRWATAVEIDPFTVPIREHEALILDALARAAQEKAVAAVIRYAGATTFWVRSERVFASTEGSFISQRTYTSMPGVGVRVSPAADDTLTLHFRPGGLRYGPLGYEAIAKANLKEELTRTTQEALRAASLPRRSVDVGRYDVVLSADALAEILVGTLGRALELDRARGQKAADAGTTYAAPPDAILGSYQLGSKLLTVSANRSRRDANATVGWDEEGVRPEDFTLVREGIVVDYVTTRRTAPAIAGWYASQRQALRSHGCAARTGSRQPVLQLPNLALRPGAAASVDDLVKTVKRGFYVARLSPLGVSVDQQCLNAQVSGSEVYEIRNGKRVRLATDMALQFNAPQFWRSLEALGGAASRSLEHVQVDQLAGSLSHIGVESVPALFRQVNVVNTGKQA